MRVFTWHCGASVLVDDAYEKFDVKAETLYKAFDEAFKYVRNSKVLDEGTLSIDMDLYEMAKALGDLASESNEDWEPVMLLEDLESCKGKHELLCTLESIVCNANLEGKLSQEENK